MSNNEKDDYMKETEEEAKRRPNEEKEGLQEPRTTGYKPLQLGIIIFVVLVLILVGFGIATDWFGIFN
ncbi:hypothetical protein QL992_08185 [Microbacterium sp. APC 3898]|jgi:uncharacterized membrane protein YkgB|uniref:Uncharacterized protein n=2 Tax=Planococcus TaxID=1372 RepID=A0ABT7ZKE6_9BACL|nr:MULTISPECIES: hypothetical protein [Terrabacteria group]MBF6633131.1 hypothetical protein [Planococcus sp. (in: firmicutes)]MBD8014766.1 hypothetical protein [Planococcus wigleyi]MDN3427636.1 hypothetical protein [Planococcus sp. APC 4016]MDN3436991.1 hypothetical protein [Planococcus sp. APC 3900]MDN3499188.1 hypothetical protein [Microbacterium sp. APC 3898]